MCERIVTIDIAPPTMMGEKARAYTVDLTHPRADARVAEVLAAEGATTLVHLAFLARPTAPAAWVHELESVGTRHVLVGAQESSVRKVVMASHTWLYGASRQNPNFIREDAPLAADPNEPYFADKIAAENEAARFAERAAGTLCTILRMAPIVGPNVGNLVTDLLARRFVPKMMGFDPLMQVLHEADAVRALKLAIDRDAAGPLNIVADGVVPLGMAITLAGRIALPIPHPVAESIAKVGYGAQLGSLPPSVFRYLRYLCVADGERARRKLGFIPTFTTREALLDFANAQRLRDVHLLEEAQP